MLSVDGLHVHYGRIHAVKGVSLEVHEGEIVSLLGPNGAGKSSTIRAIVGVGAASGGTVRFEGESLSGCAPEAIVRKGVALVPEGRRIFGRLTVEENLLIAGRSRGAAADVPDDVERAYERFPVLREFANAGAGKLSGGQQQQLAIARALMCRPRLLFLDEPTLGLAPMVIDIVFDELERMRREGVTVVLVEQHARRSLEISDRAYILSSGEVRAEGAAGELLDGDKFEAHYFGGTSR